LSASAELLVTRATHSAVFATATCLSVCLFVCHPGIVSKRLNLSKNFFDLLVARSLKLFGPLHRYPIPRRTHSAGALNTRWWEKLAIFDGNRRLSRKRCDIGRWLPWNVNRKSWVPDRTVSFSMTFSHPNPGFKVTILTSRTSKNGVF